MAKKKIELTFTDAPAEESQVVFDGFLPKVNFDDNKDELPFQFKLHEAQDQLEALASITDDAKGVLKTLKDLLKHNGKLEVKVEKKTMRGVYYDASNAEEVEALISDGITPIKIVIESFIIDKKCKASVFYKGPKDLQQHNKLAQHAGHRLKLALSIPQGELFEKED